MTDQSESRDSRLRGVWEMYRRVVETNGLPVWSTQRIEAERAVEESAIAEAQARSEALAVALLAVLDKCETCGEPATWMRYFYETDYRYCDEHMPKDKPRRNDRRYEPEILAAVEALATFKAVSKDS